MKKNRYTEEQIAYALKQAELGTAVPELCRKLRDCRADLLPLVKQVSSLCRCLEFDGYTVQKGCISHPFHCITS